MNVRPGRAAQGSRAPGNLVESIAFKVGALIVTAGLAIFLWQYAIGAIAYGASLARVSETTRASIEQCARGLNGDNACVVSFTDGTGTQRTAELEHPGLFSLSPDDQITVALRDTGAVGMAGWQPVADAGLLTLLSIALTGYAIGWWRRVLDHNDPLYDGGDPVDDTEPDWPPRDRRDRHDG